MASEDWVIKPNASNWKYEDLLHIGISYAEAEMNLSDLMTKMGLSETTYPSEQKLIVDGIKKIWTFSFEFDERNLNETDKQENMNIGEEGIKTVLKNLKKVQKFRNKTPTTAMNREKCQVFDRWNVYLTEFMKYFRELLVRLNMKKEMQGEEKFTHLFMLFSRIVFLSPEPGHTFKMTFDIKNQPVSGYPDVRFIAHESQKTIAVIEVKKEEVFKTGRPLSPAILTHIPGPLLGQHAIELLLEKTDSFFDRGVAGIVCIGTKVVFTFLEIENDEYRKMKQYCTPTKKGRGKIYYTKHFDFMKTDDRNEIVIPLLKFASLQSQTDHP